jgi:hypothetical protein
MQKWVWTLGTVAPVALAGCALDVADQAELGDHPAPAEEAVGSVQQALLTFEVGIVKTNPNLPCPSGNPADASFYLDMEDTQTSSTLQDWRSGFSSIWALRPELTFPQPGTVLKGSGIGLSFCSVHGRVFRGTNDDDFAVLKLGTTCPNGSMEQSIRLDTEDSNNNNRWAGKLGPNIINYYSATLFFCVFPGIQDFPLSEFPKFGIPYAVFHDFDQVGSTSINRLLFEKKYFYFDDEDTNSISRSAAPPLGNMLQYQAESNYADKGYWIELARVQ